MKLAFSFEWKPWLKLVKSATRIVCICNTTVISMCNSHYS